MVDLNSPKRILHYVHIITSEVHHDRFNDILMSAINL